MASIAAGWVEEREPDMVRYIGGTVIKVYGPGVLSEQERKQRREAVVRAVAKCITSANMNA